VPLSTHFQSLWRKLLFSWAKVTIFPENPDIPKHSEHQTIYVLADRGFSDLLVLQQACIEYTLPDPLYKPDKFHSIYSVAAKSQLIDWMRSRKKESAMLNHFIEQCKTDDNFDVRLVPASVFWGRP